MPAFRVGLSPKKAVYVWFRRTACNFTQSGKAEKTIKKRRVSQLASFVSSLKRNLSYEKRKEVYASLGSVFFSIFSIAVAFQEIVECS